MGLNAQDKETLIHRYKERLDQYGVADPRVIASGPKERHWMRFQTLIEVGDLRGKRILDLGCGTGDLVQFLTEREIAVDYTGYDINPYLIEAAQQRFPNHRFEVRDILAGEPFPSFDFILGQAVFNYRLSHIDNFKFVQQMLRVCYEHMTEGMAFDFISSYADFHPEYAYPYSPEVMFSFAKTLSKRVTLRHDQPLFEFVLYVYPDFAGWRDG
jgi:trans-aconitate methyltransferase